MMIRRRSVQGSPVFRLSLRLRNRARRLFRRRRSRRLLSAFIKLRRELGKPVEVFDAEQLNRMLWTGQPDDGFYYLERFLPVSWADRSELCRKLYINVGVFKILAKVAAGGEEGDRTASLYTKPCSYYLEKPGRSGLGEIVAAVHADRTRGSTLWQTFKLERVDRIMDLVARCPELQGEARVQLPCKRPMLWDAAPNWLPKCPQLCRQTTNRVPADLLIRAFLCKRLLPIHGKKHSARSRNLPSQSATPYKKMVQIAPQPAVLEGVSHAPIVCHVPHVMNGPSKISGIFSSSTKAVTGDKGADSTVLEKQDHLATGRDLKLSYA
ncbi:unnamed protein product [Urochloa decumbens]|uniref:Uncharacterized protein n=1 Tax=Urochloa decumbens TaxID=240449 RepID=A0ABC8YXB6_9POAL